MAAHVSAMGGSMRPPLFCGSVTGQWTCGSANYSDQALQMFCSAA
jgi:hypothetical protein